MKYNAATRKIRRSILEMLVVHLVLESISNTRLQALILLTRRHNGEKFYHLLQLSSAYYALPPSKLLYP